MFPQHSLEGNELRRIWHELKMAKPSKTKRDAYLDNILSHHEPTPDMKAKR